MVTNNKTKIYNAKIHGGVCACGKRGCNLFIGRPDERTVTVYYRRWSVIIEAVCPEGHVNELRI